MASSFCHVFLHCAGTDPNPSYQHHKWNCVKASVFRLERLFFFNLASSFGSNKNGPQVTKMCHTETFPLKLIHPCKTVYPWGNSIILWGGKKKPKQQNPPKTFCQVLTRSSLFSEKSQSEKINSNYLVLFFSLSRKEKKKRQQFFPKDIFFKYTAAPSLLTQASI